MVRLSILESSPSKEDSRILRCGYKNYQQQLEEFRNWRKLFKQEFEEFPSEKTRIRTIANLKWRTLKLIGQKVNSSFCVDIK